MATPSTLIDRFLRASRVARLLSARDLSAYRGLFVCLGLCFSLVAMAQTPERTPNPHPSSSRPTIEVSTDVMNVHAVVVNIYAVVEDRKGRLISDLNKEDFRVTEGNVRQEIDYFSRETDAALTLGIVIDTSASQGSVLAVEQQEAKTLIQQVLRPQDSAFVVNFDQQVGLLQGLTGDQQLLAGAINGTVINDRQRLVLAAALTQTGPTVGGTHFYDAVCFASKLMDGQVGRRVLVLLTDGEDLGSEANAAMALEAAQRADVIVYSVDISNRAFYLDRNMGFHGDSVLKKFSAATGGRMSRVGDARGTSAAFRQIGKELRGQYFLGYSPNKRADGASRRINVQVPHCSCKVRARRTYYAKPE
jgi:VWFA-related protein